MTFTNLESLMTQVYNVMGLDITTNVLAARYPQWKPSLSHPLLGCMINADGKEKKANIGVDVTLLTATSLDGVKGDNIGRGSTLIAINAFRKFAADPQTLSTAHWETADGADQKGLVDIVDDWIKSWGEAKAGTS
jgi:hypothetical protein